MQTETRADAELEEFLYVVTHDFKASLRAMRCLPDWIADDLQSSGVALPGDVADHIGMLQSSARHLETMLEGLTHYSRVGRLSDAPAEHDLGLLLKEAWKTCDRNRGRLTLDADDIRVHGPRNDLLQLFYVILDNAIRHGGERRIGITAAVSQRSAETVTVRIADDGIGVPKQFRETVFGPLKSLKPREKTGCAGMGLTIARKIVAALDGSLTLQEPGPGEGCVIQVTLPTAQP